MEEKYGARFLVRGGACAAPEGPARERHVMIEFASYDKALACYYAPEYQEAAKFARQLAANKGSILFVGTKRQAREIVREEATRSGSPFVDYRWLGGMLTNFKTVKQSIKRLHEMEQMVEDGTMEKLSKKESLTYSREMAKLDRSLGGIKNMNGLPDALFIIDVGFQKIAVEEANKLGIPVIGVVDTNHSPEGVDYIIPGNDDASRAVRLYARGIADAILEGRAQIVNEIVNDEFVEVDSSEEQATA